MNIRHERATAVALTMLRSPSPRAPRQRTRTSRSLFGRAGVQFEYEGTVIHVDPWNRGDYSSAQLPDLILSYGYPG